MSDKKMQIKIQIPDFGLPQSSRLTPHPPSSWALAGRGNANLVDQFKRALSSAILNAVEGNGRTSPKERARFFDIAIASAAEAASAIEVMVAFGAIRKSEAEEMSENIRIGYAMLINLRRATAG